ncbi:MAG: fatty acid desaturase [Candidatus Dadabacteria bacterium]|nr:MAG: fatty acid desaturase [Candidatus Dadabacteria bacterium]
MTDRVPARITDVLTPAELRELTQASDLQGWLSVLTTWGMIAGSFALVAWQTTWWTIAIALVILGGRHLALAILMHECSHYSLFRTKRLNDIVGRWLAAAPTWQDVYRYRTHHIQHHAHTGTEKDVDLGLVEPFPTNWSSLLRKFARDLSGVSGLKRALGLLLMDFGFLTYSASTTAKPIPQKGRPFRDIILTGARNLYPVVLTNGALYATLAWTGHGWLYSLWVISWLTTFSLFVRIRSMAEHACTEQTANQFLNTRTTYASPLARVTVAPHHVNYHLEHHVAMTVPHYKLKRLHRMLRERGVYDHSPSAPNYIEILRLVGSGKAAAAAA